MPTRSRRVPEVLQIYFHLSDLPILSDTIRKRMRDEIFRSGIISREHFDEEVKQKAIESQGREGLLNPYSEEPAELWDRRLSKIRDNLTDSYFAHNLPLWRFEEIVNEVRVQRKLRPGLLSYNPAVTHWDALLQQAEDYLALPPEESDRHQHHLQEIKVELIRRAISDQVAFVRVAKEYLTIADLKWIYSRRIGEGKIGGKAAGMLLAGKILQALATSHVPGGPPLQIILPESYFVATGVFYEFMATNNIQYYVSQKYKDIDRIENEYPELQQAYQRGRFPDYALDRLRDLLDEVGQQPLIVRSSSLLEDNFETSFAGKYESVFCPNQGDPAKNLADLTRAIGRVYASVANPDAILYRKQKNLLDYDERMAVLIQVVQGVRYSDFFFPAAAGMAYSRNPFIWNPQLRREEGFIRMVTGLGTRAVERVGEDYPRMVALSHPKLRPEAGAQQIKYYSQYYMDVLNLAENKFETKRVSEVLRGDYPGLRYLASQDKDGYIDVMVFSDPSLDPNTLVMTFDGLLTQTSFVPQMKSVLKTLEFGYGRPVDIEFTVTLSDDHPRPRVELHLLQCRPQNEAEQAEEVSFPVALSEADVVFGTTKLVPTGRVRNITHVVYVDPVKYSQISEPSQKLELARLIGRLNARLAGQTFILMGPGRWGSSNPDLGLKIGYADFYNTRILVEIGLAHGSSRPTLSYGTHFFQDLVESHIFPLAIFPGEPGNPFNQAFFDKALNALPALLPEDARYADFVKVIHVPATTGGRVLEAAMSGGEGKAVAFLTKATA
ncbi:MAG: PEP/pyruvate-binding domain-containing protein [Chloroflexi bacterium]|nr:PEP/pyruvate-binding domain-containing protein [Chloroflexota bacterium]